MTEVLGDAVRWLNDPLSWTGPRGALTLLGDHLWMTLVAVVLAAAVGLPLGAWLSRLRRGGAVVVSAANVSRAVPTLALLYIFTAGMGLGQWPTILAVAIFAVPPILSNTYTGLQQVDPAARDAGRGMGMSPVQLLLAVELPLALPLIAAGLRTAVVQVVATVPLAALVGGGGLGLIITNGIFTQRYGQALAGAVLVMLLALGVEGLLAAAQRLLGRRPSRRLPGAPAEQAPGTRSGGPALAHRGPPRSNER
ncbi:ABC transporter permease [Georgenia sp. 10Sc9-8]|uniref:ABC transporter permease n=1 Tax=Georgenia halotolerans TaxID=3028317 RepID=A0ABT5U1Q8_9MICO|nr:ABC transporter permease [Georgenia halotolerans]